MHEECEVVAYVKSRRQVVAVQEFRVPIAIPASPARAAFVYETRRVPRFERSLDLEQTRVVEHVRSQAREAGYRFRVVDLGRVNPIVRRIWRWRLGVEELPVVIWKGTCVSSRANEPRPDAWQRASIRG